MLIPVPEEERRFSNPDKYLVVLSHDFNKSDFLEAAQVINGSYAEELMERIYNCLITHAVDILKEYQKYYSDEYADLETFLYWKYNVDYAVAAEVMDRLSPEGFLRYGSVYSGGDYGIGQFIMSDPGLEMVNRTFGKLEEVSDED